MRFGEFRLAEASGGILAHSLRLSNGKRIAKGTIVDSDVFERLKSDGVLSIVVALPDESDVVENDAATQIGNRFIGEGLYVEPASTGRVNIFAAQDGVFCVSKPVIDAVNGVDPSITLATLPEYAPVNEGRLVATIKIIPYAVESKFLQQVLALDLENAFSVQGYARKRVGLICTNVPGFKESLLDKTRKTLETRLDVCGSDLVEVVTVEHKVDSVSDAIQDFKTKCDFLILFGASAISDEDDVIPSAIVKSGGSITRFGMPVDPGNLLLLGELGGIPVIGAPGCARSPAENGFDWVLTRLLAGLTVGHEDIASMGVGGLLMETGARPHPREKTEKQAMNSAAVILAAGQSRRMGKDNKMTVDFKGKPMLQHVLDAATSSGFNQIRVVTGFEAGDVEAIAVGYDAETIHNPHFEEGLSSSLAKGIGSLDNDVSVAAVLLGDMPLVTSIMLKELLEASEREPEKIIAATHQGKLGNPVLWPRRFFSELTRIKGDVGAKHVMASNMDSVHTVELGEAVSKDFDTPESLNIISH